MKPFNVIVAIDSHHGIGKDGLLPWKLPGDMKHFRELTSHTKSGNHKNVVIMGRKTWDSIPEKFRPLPERINCVITRNHDLSFPDGVLKAQGLNQALEIVCAAGLGDDIESIFIIGGGQLYTEALNHPQCQKIYLTQILEKHDCDTFFPDFSKSFEKINQSPEIAENGSSYYFAEFQRK